MSQGDEGELVVLIDGSASLGVPRVKAGSPMVFGWFNVCVEGRGSVHIDDVRAGGGRGATVSDFALRDNPSWPDGDTFSAGDVDLDWRSDLEAAGFERANKTATLRCQEEGGRAHQLGIDVSLDSRGRVGILDGFEISWNGHTSTAPFTVILCPFADASDPRCADPADS